MEISELLGQRYMERFRVFHSITLFEPYWENLRKEKCPICGNKLQLPLNKKIFYCRGVRHKKPFIIGVEKLKQLNA